MTETETPAPRGYYSLFRCGKSYCTRHQTQPTATCPDHGGNRIRYKAQPEPPTPAEREAQRLAAIEALHNRCDHCGVDTRYRDCKPWCMAGNEPCGCGSPTCGECMRYGGTSGSGFPVRLRPGFRR